MKYKGIRKYKPVIFGCVLLLIFFVIILFPPTDLAPNKVHNSRATSSGQTSTIQKPVKKDTSKVIEEKEIYTLEDNEVLCHEELLQPHNAREYPDPVEIASCKRVIDEWASSKKPYNLDDRESWKRMTGIFQGYRVQVPKGFYMDGEYKNFSSIIDHPQRLPYPYFWQLHGNQITISTRSYPDDIHSFSDLVDAINQADGGLPLTRTTIGDLEAATRVQAETGGYRLFYVVRHPENDATYFHIESWANEEDIEAVKAILSSFIVI